MKLVAVSLARKRMSADSEPSRMLAPLNSAAWTTWAIWRSRALKSAFRAAR
jgi:hypothetical protein